MNQNGFQAWTAYGFEKIKRNAVCDATSDRIRLCLAKNESESCQFVFRATGNSVTQLHIVSGSLPDGLTCALFREHFIGIGSDGYPDPLEPLPESFDIPTDKPLIILVRFTASATCAGGSYSCPFSLCDETGTVLKTMTAELRIWDFALPERTACASAVGLSGDMIARFNGITDDAGRNALYRDGYETLLSYKLSAYDLPYDILDDRADAYMSDPRVTAFRIPYADDDEKIRAYYDKLSRNPEWMKKAYFYPLDEPHQKDALDRLAAIAERLGRLFPGYRLCTPFFVNMDYDENTDQIAFMTGKTNVWCPKSFMYHSDTIYNENQKRNYPPFPARMAERQTAGDEVWWYVCWEPGDPYCNLFVNEDGIRHRILFWQQKLNRVTGFLYWHTDYWMQTQNPWEDMATVKDLSPSVFGDGSLLYNGSKVGMTGFCGSLRLEAIRDGIEDYDLLTLAEQALGEAFVREQIQAVTPELVTYTLDGTEFLRIREAIGNALEKKCGE